MYQLNYADIQQDSVADAKERERRILQRCVDLLRDAKQGTGSPFAKIEAVHFVTRVWSSFLEDLASEQNELPQELRAALISIGLWMLREAEAIRQGESDNIDGLLDVTEIIKGSLK